MKWPTALVLPLAICGMGVALELPVASSTPRLPDQPQVTTLAGSGLVGFADGPAANASFVAPAGLHFGPDGMLYVADRGAQRIRRISPDGTVSSIAGSGAMVPLGVGVAGGFANGAASSARFNDPLDVAVRTDGTVLVVDTGNACVRAIARGLVSTFAGRCGEAGATNGAADLARFTAPRSIAIATDGTVFVADPPNGIRRIDRGMVSSLNSPHSVDAIGIATIGNDSSALAIATATLIDVVDSTTGIVRAELPLDTSYVSGSAREGAVPAGPAVSIASFSADDFVYADPLNGIVMLAQVGSKTGNGGSYIRILGAVPPFDAPVAGETFADGSDGHARYDEPVAVAIAPNGSVAVADLGDRRIRTLSAFDRDTHVTRRDEDAELPEAPDPSVIRIAIVGDSYLWSLQGRDDSIAGEFEDDLNRQRKPGSKPYVVYPIMRAGGTIFNLLSYIDGEFADGGFDAVVLDLPDRGHFPGDTTLADSFFPPGWPTRAVSTLEASRSSLAANGTRLLLLLHPGALDFEDEIGYRQSFKGSSNPLTVTPKDPAEVQRFRDDTLNVAVRSGVPTIDAWPRFLADHGEARRTSLFGTWDHHLTPHGRTLVVDALATYFAAHPAL